MTNLERLWRAQGSTCGGLETRLEGKFYSGEATAVRPGNRDWETESRRHSVTKGYSLSHDLAVGMPGMASYCFLSFGQNEAAQQPRS